MKKTEKTIELADGKLTLSTGAWANQASGAVLASYGETTVLATVVASPLKEDWGYFPLSVEYMERLYAGGRIKGSRWVKREGRPSDAEILTARLIDRSIRPLFPKNYKKEIQVAITVLSVDLKNRPDIVAAVAASAAIEVAGLPWQGPVGIVKIGSQGKDFIVNPKDAEIESGEMELIVSSTEEAIVMIENAAQQVSEDEVLSAIELAHKENQKVIAFIKDFATAAGAKRQAFSKDPVDKDIEKKVKDLLPEKKAEELAAKLSTKEAGNSDFSEVRSAVVDSFEKEDQEEAAEAFDKIFAQTVRKMLLAKKRPDGRKPDQLRSLSAETAVLPRTHGSAVFQRGQTQALTVATLGSSSMGQLIESAEGEEEKNYIHHYSMPPYSVGETGRMGWPSRREIGHGALAEKALLPVLPSTEEFPYTIRVVTEILSSNGSTSMASVCGSTLSLMDAGVPIKDSVAGIAMGVIIDKKESVVLTDIVGLEDANGDMDFKVAGTKKGITALQLDVKSLSLTPAILKKALAQAKDARLEILAVMDKAISKSRSQVSQYAPKIKTLQIPQDKIGELIGPGGKNIKSIIAETGADVDVNDDGLVSISGVEPDGVAAAIERVEAITREAVPGEIYEGEVKRIEPFGAFVEIFPGKDGMVHVSDMSEAYVKDPKEIVSLGDKVKVRVKEIDNLGRVNLSMILDPTKEKPKKSSRGGGSDRGRSGRSRHPRRHPRSSGPHFPASKLVDSKKRF